MFTIDKAVQIDFTINKSIFITNLKPASTVEEAKEFINEMKHKYSDATHNVTVYIIGKTGEYGHANDDGEPQSTAAAPIFDCFKKNNLTNFVCVVSRYFGGIKLGAGGLIRSYSKAASLALKEAQIIKIIDFITIQLVYHYSLNDILSTKLQSYDLLEKRFSSKITAIYKIPQDDFVSLKLMLENSTSNQIEILIIN